MAINESKMLISCGGRYHLAFNKIFESMACNTLYVGEKPYGEEELHLKDGYNYVAVTKDNFADKIKYYLKNPNEMETISNNAKDTFLKYHNIQSRAIDFITLLKKIL
jgi:spore maturation protein CgeB